MNKELIALALAQATCAHAGFSTIVIMLNIKRLRFNDQYLILL